MTTARNNHDACAGSGPLAGLRILDLSTVLMGPYATQILGDLGADVIKVEPPSGDNMRAAGPMKDPGMGHIFMHLNRNKRGIVLDLKHPDGRAAVMRLAARSDVFFPTLRPAAAERLGVS